MTNQASEDELMSELRLLYGRRVSSNLSLAEYFLEMRQLIRTEKLKLLNELDKSMQLTTKYGYHMPEKQYGYKLVLHDIREVIAKLEAEL